jgi:hypothetical protein
MIHVFGPPVRRSPEKVLWSPFLAPHVDDRALDAMNAHVHTSAGRTGAKLADIAGSSFGQVVPFRTTIWL